MGSALRDHMRYKPGGIATRCHRCGRRWTPDTDQCGHCGSLISEQTGYRDRMLRDVDRLRVLDAERGGFGVVRRGKG